MVVTADRPDRFRPWFLPILCAGSAILAAGWVVSASFPGFLSIDSAMQLQQAVTGRLDDWHQVFTVIVWSLLLHLLPGAAGYLLLETLLIWGSFLALALSLRHSFGDAALVIALLPLVPGVCNFLGNVQIDTMLVGWLLAGATLGWAAHRMHGTGSRLCCQVAANLCLAFGVLTRLNAILCVVPLLLHANRWTTTGPRRKPARTIALCIMILVSLPVIDRFETAATGAARTGVFDSIETYNLLALSFREHETLLPGRWTPEQSRRIVEGCYSPVQWDAASTGRCSFILDALQTQGLWNSRAMTRSWLHALAAHPLGFVSIQLASFQRAMFQPNSPAMFWPTPSPWNDAAPHPPAWWAATWKAYVQSRLDLAVSRPWIAVLLSAVGLLLMLRLERPFEGTAGLGTALMLSGLIYLLGFFAYGVSAEYRYYSWSGFCAVLGVTLAVLCTHAGRCRTTSRTLKASRSATWFTLGMVAVSGALVLTAHDFQLPTTTRRVSVQAIGGGPVRLLAVHDATEPDWMGRLFGGHRADGGWTFRDWGFDAVPNAPALVETLSMPRRDIEVRFASGPGQGRARIELDGHLREIDTAATATGVIPVMLPPKATTPGLGVRFTLRWVGEILAWSVVLFLLGQALVRRPRKQRRAAS
ncbi:hypothetical protein [Lichenicola sp.]|uniref:hypothetical protein n=1 Tax=Lichenicola sp. TaxID=2804529 RepID=UPI003B00D9B5